MLKNMKKSTKSNVITLGIVVGFYVLIQILSAAGALTNSFSGQLVPICAYVIMAVSLNLTVGMLGELSLGHAGFMSVGAFSGTLVYVVMSETPRSPLHCCWPSWSAARWQVCSACSSASPFCVCPVTTWPSSRWLLVRSSRTL